MLASFSLCVRTCGNEIERAFDVKTPGFGVKASAAALCTFSWENGVIPKTSMNSSSAVSVFSHYKPDVF